MLSLAQAAALAPPDPSLFASIVLPGSGQLVVVAGGGRDLAWPSELIATHLLRATRGRLVQALLHGAARGADQAIAAAADQLGWPQIACPAAWSEHGRAAGPIRNRQMLERSLDLASALPLGAGLLVIGFPGSRGTTSLLDQAKRLSRRSAIPIEVIQIPQAA
ncbi:DUF2493 domain-containing protein [Synechococcus sp. CB0101]|uniref:SLOG family protein n=1 Tax=Synechococcus sp. CB0101 TaxID=232348 RepID=UPI00020012CF|nr:SLOG family protein [Synechococcus sp. CB0101]QCH15560.1 DUF2493 domain-containing protein [Synechococcus sp. CB0101]